MEIPKELYKLNTLLTLGGASVAVVVVGGVSGHVFGFNPRWLALLVAQILAFLGVYQIRKEIGGKKLAYCLVALVNGALIYSQAVGFNTLNNGVSADETTKAALIPIGDIWWPSASREAATKELLEATEGVSELLEEVKGLKTDLALAQDALRESQRKTAALITNRTPATVRLAREANERAKQVAQSLSTKISFDRTQLQRVTARVQSSRRRAIDVYGLKRKRK